MTTATNLTRHFAALTTAEAELVDTAIKAAASLAYVAGDTDRQAALIKASSRIRGIYNAGPSADRGHAGRLLNSTLEQDRLSAAAEIGGDDGWVMARPAYRPSDDSPEAEAYRAAYTQAAHDRVWAILNERA